MFFCEFLLNLYIYGSGTFSRNKPIKEPVDIPLPIRVSDDKHEVQKWPILDVHSVIDYLWNDVGLRVPMNHVEEFWRHSREYKQPWALEHEATERHIPLGLYGDSAKITTTFNSDKMLGVFFNLPLWRPRSIRRSRFLIFAIEESKLWGHHTLTAVLSRVTWSVNLLFDGLRPFVDPAGHVLPKQELYGGYICKDKTVFAVTEIRGDQLWQKQVFRFTASWIWTSARVCHACDCRAHGPDSEHRLYWDFEAWLPYEFSNTQFLAKRMPSRFL